MQRGSVTQKRFFNWTGSDLTSTTNPENGTVAYTYDSAHHVLTRLDAKGQQTNYTYDIYGRLTLVQHLVSGTEDLTQRISYYYDAIPPGYQNGSATPFNNPPSGCCSNTAGRLAAVQFPNSNSNVGWFGDDVQQLVYLYSYNQAGRVTMQDLRLAGGGSLVPTMDFTATHTWDNMGRMTGMNYPLNGPQVAMYYDAMSNLSSETQVVCQAYDQNGDCVTWGPSPLASATYNFAGQLTALNYNNFSITGSVGAYGWFQTETHTYNSMLQLTNIASSSPYPSGAQLNMTYAYSTTQNNGRIVSSVDAVSGENVSYTYDSLNRLIAAATSGTTGVQWGDSYSYDGFGNLTSKVVTKGTAPQVYPQVNSATNQARMSGDYGFDANGNWLGAGGSQINTWNVENQLIATSGSPSNGDPTYTYDPWGKRVLQYSETHTYGPGGTLYFYSITGQRLGTYQVSYVSANDPPLQQSVSMYFGGRLLAAVDRLGSVRNNANGHGPIAYYPWGEERTTTPDGTDKFATYFRDSNVGGVGQDYANARYYNNNFGRFWSPDPMGAAHANDPQSWNRYTYGGSDPVNRSDPTGLDTILAPPGPGPSGCAVYAADNSTCLVVFPPPFPFCWGGTEVDPVFTCFGDGGGGTGGTQPTQPSRNIPFPECNPGGTRTQNLEFIAYNYQAAESVQSATGVPADWLLAWSADESNSKNPDGSWLGWGSAPQVTQDGNYFNEESSGWVLQIPCGAGSYKSAIFACFSGFQDSAMSALTSFGDRYLNAFNGAVGNGETAAFQAIADAGFTPNQQYGKNIASVTNSIDQLLGCLLANGYIVP